MNTTERTSGSAFTRDEEYYEFLGGEYKGRLYDWYRRCWVDCIMQAPKTPLDRVTPAEADAAMTPERMPYTPIKLTRNHRAEIVANAERKHTEALAIYTAYFREHGPSPMRDLLGLTSWRNRITIGQHFAAFPDVYRFFPTLRLWGLQGQTLEDRQ